MKLQKYSSRAENPRYRVFEENVWCPDTFKEDGKMKQMQNERPERFRKLKYAAFFVLGYAVGNGWFSGCCGRAYGNDIPLKGYSTGIERHVSNVNGNRISYLDENKIAMNVVPYISESGLENLMLNYKSEAGKNE